MAVLLKNFHHPYKPYDIQVELMNAIYDCIADGKIGIFESPTGTGKSLSLICSSLTWLRDSQEEPLAIQTSVGEDDGEPKWALEHAHNQKREAIISQKAELEARLKHIRAKELRQKQRYENGESIAKRIRTEDTGCMSDSGDEARYELDEYNSDAQDTKPRQSTYQSGELGLSSASMHLMEKLGMVPVPSSMNEEFIPADELKIYFCSRTHSQLTQFIHELGRVDIPAASWTEEDTTSGPGQAAKENSVIKHLPLGSRKHLCINSKVSKLGSAPAITERCLELQQPNTPKDRKCPFVPNNENKTLVNDFRDHTLAKIRDIEDLSTLGKKIGICPYYASRASIKPSEIVSLPYPLLLQKSAREALDISLKGHVIIIDEAHNLMDTITNIHSISVTQSQLRRCRAQLGAYVRKFRNRLKGKNRVYVAQVVRLIDSMSSYLDGKAAAKQATEGIAQISDLMAGKSVDQINLYKLMHYLQASKLARKVEGYANHTQAQADKDNAKFDAKHHVSTMPLLSHVQAFFQTLTNPAAEGRFFYEKDEYNDLALKYMLLDPTCHFREIVEEARAVILAGGTMAPVDDYVHHLFGYVDPGRLTTFSCGHIIPEENLIALIMAKGPGDLEFDFTYEKRDLPAMIETLGSCLVQLSSTIPDGLVVFFPSYVYLDQVVVRWQTKSARTTKNIWDLLLEKKPIFRESKTTIGVDDVLSQYSQAIATGKGGLLLSVIGGKMSEGINFSDALGRGVVVVGLPFPNIQSAQWKAKLEYIEHTTAKRTGKIEGGKVAAREYYENACMRAVNQSIGRAIRHKGDYASILLLDRRFKAPRIEGKLPGWIRQGISSGRDSDDFRQVTDKLRVFFASKQKP